MADDGGILQKAETYAKERMATMRQGGVMLATGFVFLAVARTPGFQLSGLLGLEGDIHNGYVGAYGHFLLGALIAVFSWRLSDCLALREQVLADVTVEDCLEQPDRRTERYLLRLPYDRGASSSDSGGRKGKQFAGNPFPHVVSIAPLVPLLFGTFLYGIFLWNYFRFYRDGAEADRIRDLMFGGPNGMFPARWDLAMGKGETIVINAPLQTWIGLLVGAYLIYQLLRVVGQVREATPIAAAIAGKRSKREGAQQTADRKEPAPQTPAQKAAAKKASDNEGAAENPAALLPLQPAGVPPNAPLAVDVQDLACGDKLVIQQYVLSLVKVYGGIAVVVLGLISAFLFTGIDAIAQLHVNKAIEPHLTDFQAKEEIAESERKKLNDDLRTAKLSMDQVLRVAKTFEGITATFLQRQSLIDGRLTTLEDRQADLQTLYRATKGYEELSDRVRVLEGQPKAPAAAVP